MGPTQSAGRHPLIGVAYTGDAEDRTARSGTPFGVIDGVRQNLFSAVALKATPGLQLDRAVAGFDALLHVAQDFAALSRPAEAKLAYQGAHLGRATSVVRSASLSARPSARRADMTIALGTGYRLPTVNQYVVYDDMTVKQAIDAGYPEWRYMRESDRRFRLAQQQAVYSRAIACCMTTSWAAESVARDYGIPEERIVVVGAGTHEVPRKVERDYSVPRMLFVGLNWDRKNGDRVLAGFQEVRKKHPSATLDLVGRHPAVALPGVTVHGRLYRDRTADFKKLESLYNRATCFVMPSLHEPGGVVFVEAAAAGLGSVAGTVGGSRDFVGDSGVLVDPTDQAAITAAMLELADPIRAAALGQLAEGRVELFTWKAVAGRLLRALGFEVDAEFLQKR